MDAQTSRVLELAEAAVRDPVGAMWDLRALQHVQVREGHGTLSLTLWCQGTEIITRGECELDVAQRSAARFLLALPGLAIQHHNIGVPAWTLHAEVDDLYGHSVRLTPALWRIRVRQLLALRPEAGEHWCACAQRCLPRMW